jgi:hypothetical protein
VFSVQGKKKTLMVGMGVCEGDRILTQADGRVRLRFVGEETSIRLGAASDLSVFVRDSSVPAGRKHVLHRGRLSAVVAKQPEGRPFLVETPRARATVVGTKLAMLDDGTVTRLQVVEGEVLLERISDGKAIPVKAGRLGEVAPDRPLRTYATGGTYVDGPVFFQDDFEGDLREWEVGALEKSGETLRAIDPSTAHQRLSMPRVKVRGRPSKVAGVERKADDRFMTVIFVARSFSMEAFSAEFDSRTEPGSLCGYLVAAGERRRTLLDKNVPLHDGRWRPYRLEVCRRANLAEGPFFELKMYRSGTLVLHTREFATEVWPGCAVTKGKVTIDNFIVRTMVPAASPP